VENDLEGVILEIWETEEDKKLSIDGLRRFYKDFALKNFRLIPYINKNTGWKIRVSAGIENVSYFNCRCKINGKLHNEKWKTIQINSEQLTIKNGKKVFLPRPYAC
jgi:hypothetical protein